MNIKSPVLSALLGAATLLMTPHSHAALIDLFGWGFNLDGTTYCSGGGCANSGQGSLPGSVNASGFDFDTGLGSISIDIGGAGTHSILSFFDHDIDSAINTFFNENGATSNAAATGQSWEIDEPGFFPNPPNGDIFNNFLASSLDNGIFTPSGLTQDDVSMAMGWDFALAAGETATVEFLLAELAPTTNGLILNHSDPDSAANIYFTSTLSIQAVPPVPMPEPGTIALFGLALAGLSFARRK